MRISLASWGLVGVCSLGCSVSTTLWDPPPPTPTSGPTSVFQGVATQAATPPPPLVGGTVRIIRDAAGAYVLASNQDEDSVAVVALPIGDTRAQPVLVGTVQFLAGEQPNRIVGDGKGHAFVVLRGGGGIATIDITHATLLGRTSTCPAPRGLDYDAAAGLLYVACATGELVTVDATTFAVRSTTRVDQDLRDVVVQGATRYVSRFRAAELLQLDTQAAVANRVRPDATGGSLGAAPEPVVAWRTRPSPSGHVVMLHQLAATSSVAVVPHQTYYAETPGIISSASIAVDARVAVPLSVDQVVDLTFDDADNAEVLSIDASIQLLPVTTPSSTANVALLAPATVPGGLVATEFVGLDDGRSLQVPWVVAMARTPFPSLHFYTGLTAGLQTAAFDLPLSTVSHADTGFDVFHLASPIGTACMNCHPEGGDDGHAWKFILKDVDGTVLDTRLRRTQSLLGGETTVSAPYHWDGDLADLDALMGEVFTHRMGGGTLTPEQSAVLARWLDATPPPPQRNDLDPASVARGQALFGGVGGCTQCHNGGARVANIGNQDVGKVDALGSSKALKVPMLQGVANRAPYMHDGCAATLMDRLTNPACAGSKHGNTASLDATQLGDLEAYLESL